MILSELIIDLKEKSGRLDLTETQLTVYLNQGSRLLDDLETSDFKEQKIFRRLSSGEKFVKIPAQKRFIKSVHCISSEGRFGLMPTQVEDIIDAFHTDIDVHTGSKFWAPMQASLANLPAEEYNISMEIEPLTFDMNQTNTYIVIYPVPTESVTIEVKGAFYSYTLSNAVPSNRWCVNHSHLLVLAAQHYMMQDLLDFNTAASIKAGLVSELLPLSYDTYMEENINQMRG